MQWPRCSNHSSFLRPMCLSRIGYTFSSMRRAISTAVLVITDAETGLNIRILYPAHISRITARILPISCIRSRNGRKASSKSWSSSASWRAAEDGSPGVDGVVASSTCRMDSTISLHAPASSSSLAPSSRKFRAPKVQNVPSARSRRWGHGGRERGRDVVEKSAARKRCQSSRWR